MAWRVFKILILTMALPLALGGAFWTLEKQGFFAINSLQVVLHATNQQPAYFQPLEAELNTAVEKWRGVSLWKLNLVQVQAQLLQYPWIDQVSLARRWPTELVIEVKPKDISLLLVSAKGGLRPLAADGQLLPRVSVKSAPDVPILSGENFETQPELRKSALSVYKAIPEKGAFSQKTISEIHFDEHDGFWMTTIRNGVRVKLGLEKVEIKSARVAQVMEYLQSRQMDARVIDANLSKKVLVRLRKEP